MPHRIITDTAGWGNWPRLTCTTCNKTLLRKPYMNNAQWQKSVREFRVEHPVEQLERNLKTG